VTSNPPDQRTQERRQLAVIPDGNATTVRVIVDPEPVFPGVCAKCRGRARKTLAVERVFTTFEEGSDGNYWVHSVAAYRVPFCEECVNRHRAELITVPAWRRIRGALFDESGQGIAGVIVFGIGIWVASTMLQRPPQRLAEILFASILPVAACLVGGTLWLSAWSAARYLAVPEPTSVTGAMDFSEILSEKFEPAWRTFRFRNAEYAELFREANAARLWNPTGAVAKAARRKRRKWANVWGWVGAILVGMLALWWLYDTIIEPLFDVQIG
jgi:hypothetical protein